MPPKLIRGTGRKTHPLVWGFAIICTIIAIGVIVAGLVVFIGYMIIGPRVPFISVIYAKLDRLDNSQAEILQIQMSLVIRAENDNAKAHASFSDFNLLLSFHGVDIAELRNDPFDIPKNKSQDFTYVAQSTPIPLDPEEQEEVDLSLKQNKITFDLKGSVRTRWRVGILGSVKFWGHLDCQLQFFPYNGSRINKDCSTKSR
ncbi:hypothetical protein NE237_029248 [Protea cynaroides]|uniref:Late embryogenesis abundant protein LEA-2 subgroup domain-containing protein n=1 Tax=Protea cynaroides TaxID=273540 RepID=A0A9Q0GQU2_9MAGN|nr:hypothetical protein NE237_029248 [Protea cynaroides]